jgi:tetratricopeptide (TPR) repeat protein
MTNRTVALMIDAGVTPQAIADTLPDTPEVLIAIQGHFLAAEQGPAYLDLVERDLAHASPTLLRAYGEACLVLRLPERLESNIKGLGRADEMSVQAERDRQQAHAVFALGRNAEALAFANDARRAAPDDATYEEFYGEIALSNGLGGDAAVAFQRALSIAVRAGATTQARARLYGFLGQALELDGHGDLAVDAYRHAVALDSTESHASIRLAAIDAAVMGRNSQ